MKDFPDPARVVVAGDWHGHTEWGRGVIGQLPGLLPNPEDSPRLVLQLGDFGIWPGNNTYLAELDDALRDVNGHLWFIDGNHEDFAHLSHCLNSRHPTGYVQMRNRIRWLPRGHRWTWHDRTWLALGGAVSVDRIYRTPGRDWWPEEEITEAQTRRVIDDGPADVMICHDCPSTVPLYLPAPPTSWDLRDLANSDRHRERLQAIVDQVQPTHLMHGHYHLVHDTTVDMDHGPVQVTGLDCDGAWTGNHRVLNVKTMEWETGR